MVPMLVEVGLLAVLFVSLGIAGCKFFRVLERLGIPWTRGMPVAAMIAGTMVLTGRRILRGVRFLRGGTGDGNSRREDT